MNEITSIPESPKKKQWNKSNMLKSNNDRQQSERKQKKEKAKTKTESKTKPKPKPNKMQNKKKKTCKYTINLNVCKHLSSKYK